MGSVNDQEANARLVFHEWCGEACLQPDPGGHRGTGGMEIALACWEGGLGSIPTIGKVRVDADDFLPEGTRNDDWCALAFLEWSIK